MWGGCGAAIYAWGCSPLCNQGIIKSAGAPDAAPRTLDLEVPQMSILKPETKTADIALLMGDSCLNLSCFQSLSMALRLLVWYCFLLC
jgi:hypothetical protein